MIDKLIKLTMLGEASVWLSVDCIDFMYRTFAVNCNSNENIPYTRIVTTHEEFFVKETPEEIEQMWAVMRHEN